MSASHSSLNITLFLAALVMAPLPVFADDMAIPPTADKSDYTLFNPVPDAMMRAFTTDRPTKSSAPNTVDAGHFQYESDIVNWTYDHNNTAHVTTSNLMVADSVLKMGLTQNTDFELALSPFNFNNSHDRTMGINNTAAGFGDLDMRVKFNLFGNDGGEYAMAIVPYIKVPTAAHNLGNGYWEGGVYTPFQAMLPLGWMLDVTPEIDVQENAAMNGDHVNFQTPITFGHSVFDDSLTGYVELWSDFNSDQNAATQYTGDIALAWQAGANTQLDIGLNTGLNKAAPDLQPYLGLSQRF